MEIKGSSWKVQGLFVLKPFFKMSKCNCFTKRSYLHLKKNLKWKLLIHWDAMFLIHQNIFISVKKFCGKCRAFIWSLNTNTHPLTAWRFLATGPMGVFSKTLQYLPRSMASAKVLQFNFVTASQGSTSHKQEAPEGGDQNSYWFLCFGFE